MVGRRTMLQGLAALVAGGRQAAAAVEREVAGAVAGSGLATAIGSGLEQTTQPVVSNSDWYHSPAAMLQGMRRWERESQRAHGYMDPWIVTMRSVPAATKARWMREIRMREQEEETAFMATLGRALGLGSD